VGKGGRETSIDAPRRFRRAHAEPLKLPRDFTWARRKSAFAHPTRLPTGCHCRACPGDPDREGTARPWSRWP